LKIVVLVFFIITVSLFADESSAKLIKVGGYLFPPFVEKNLENEYVGITIDFIKEMNLIQDKFKFEFVPISSKRRYASYDNKKFDLIIFEDKNWGWEDKNIISSDLILEGGEVYITKADPSKNQTYFDDFTNKEIALILGYHYGFADFNSDEDFLNKHFNIQFSTTHSGNIKKILIERADLSVVTLSYLNKFFDENPSEKCKILVSKKFDQKYKHRILLREDSEVKIEEINSILYEMKDTGVLLRIWKKYGIN